MEVGIKCVLEGNLDVFFLKKVLFSIDQATNKGLVITYINNTCFLTNVGGEGKVVMIRVKSSKLYKLQIKVVPSELIPNTKWPKLCNFALFGNSRTCNNLSTWHYRFGHIHFGMILQMAKSGMVTNMPLSDKEEIKLCEGCVLGKNHSQPYPTNVEASRSKKARKFFHFDVCGPMNVNSLGETKYNVLFMDNFSGYRFVFCIKKQNKSNGVFQEGER